MMPNGWSRANHVRFAANVSNTFARRVESTLRKHDIALWWLLLAPNVVLFFASASCGTQTSLPIFDVEAYSGKTDGGSSVASHDVAHRLRIALTRR